MTLRVGVVGIGRRGQEWVRVVRGTSGFDLAACVDLDEAALRHAGNGLGVPADRCHQHLEAALDAARPDALIVATPLDRHVDPCRTALGRGLAVLVEKPFATSLREARQLQALAEQRRVPLLVVQNYRYTRMPRAVRRLVAEGVLGRVGMVTCESYKGRDPVSASVRAHRNGLIWETAVHHLDALRYVLGQEAVRVMAHSFSVPWSPEQSGRLAPGPPRLRRRQPGLVLRQLLHGGQRALRARKSFLPANASASTAPCPCGSAGRFLCLRGRAPRLVRRGRREVSEEVTLLRQLERALRSGEEPECNGRDNLRTVAVLEACARSAAEGRWVDPRELLREPI